jgi:hypothetical protein
LGSGAAPPIRERYALPERARVVTRGRPSVATSCSRGSRTIRRHCCERWLKSCDARHAGRRPSNDREPRRGACNDLAVPGPTYVESRRVDVRFPFSSTAIIGCFPSVGAERERRHPNAACRRPHAVSYDWAAYRPRCKIIVDGNLSSVQLWALHAFSRGSSAFAMLGVALRCVFCIVAAIRAARSGGAVNPFVTRGLW